MCLHLFYLIGKCTERLKRTSTYKICGYTAQKRKQYRNKQASPLIIRLIIIHLNRKIIYKIIPLVIRDININFIRAAFHHFSTLRIHSINTETFDGNEDAIKEAKAVLESQGAGYRNFSIDSASDTGRYASDIMAFPTTILVDRNGNIVGNPLLGGIDNQDNYDALMKQIQAVADADSTDK